jgi:hypothetical protein
MRRGQRQQIWFYVFAGLAVLGILNMFRMNPMGVILPVIVIGVIFLLYKYPPSRWRGTSASNYRTKTRGTSDGRTHQKRTAKRAKFRVIPGTKRDDDKDNLPKYH